MAADAVVAGLAGCTEMLESHWELAWFDKRLRRMRAEEQRGESVHLSHSQGIQESLDPNMDFGLRQAVELGIEGDMLNRGCRCKLAWQIVP